MRTTLLPLLSALVIVVMALSLCGCPSQPTPETDAAALPTPEPPPAAPDATATAGAVAWMENPTVADIPDAPVKGQVNGEPFEAKTTRVKKGDGKSTLELANIATDKPSGMLMDDTEVKLDFTIEPGKTGEFVKAMAAEDPKNTDAWYSYEQKDGTPMTMNSDWAVALQITEWTMQKDPNDEAVLGHVKGKVFITFNDDKKTFAAGTFEGPYFE